MSNLGTDPAGVSCSGRYSGSKPDLVTPELTNWGGHPERVGEAGESKGREDWGPAEEILTAQVVQFVYNIAIK